MNMASKDKYKSLLERYKQPLIKNPKLNLSAYCRLNGVSVSGMPERAAVLYTLALSAKMNHLKLFDYLVDILDKTATWQPNTPLEKYRNLLPDCWQPSTED